MKRRHVGDGSPPRRWKRDIPLWEGGAEAYWKGNDSEKFDRNTRQRLAQSEELNEENDSSRSEIHVHQSAPPPQAQYLDQGIPSTNS